MICKKCGTENSAESVFCAKCGERFETIVSGDTINPEQNQVLNDTIPTTDQTIETLGSEPSNQPIIEPMASGQSNPTIVDPTASEQPNQPIVEPVTTGQPNQTIVQPATPDINTEIPVYTEPQSSSINSVSEEKGNILWGILGFFVPLVGIILFFVWLKKKPKDSKTSLIGAIIGFVLSIVLVVLLFSIGILNLSLLSFFETTNTPTTNEDITDVVETKEVYNVGDAVTTVDGSKWHIIAVKGDNLTLLLDELVVEETGYGQTASEEDQKYANSLVKKYIDETYMPSLSTKIDAAGGDSSKIVGRLLSMDDYLSITMSKFDDNYYTTSHTVDAYDNVDEVCKMIDILALTKSFWTSSNVRDYNSSSTYFGVIYIKRGAEKHDYFCDKTMPETYAIVDSATDGTYQMGATLVGIRPVIETPSSNIE